MELSTERLSLRRWREADRAPFAAMNADPEVMRWFPGLLARLESDRLADRIESHIAREGWGLWALEERATGRFLGFTGLARAAFEAPFTPAVEIGWRLSRSAWGSGFATEAARAAAAFAFEELALDELVSFTAGGNARSRAVMRRLGMRHDPADDFDHPSAGAGPIRRHVLYRLAAPTFAPRVPPRAHEGTPSHLAPGGPTVRGEDDRASRSLHCDTVATILLYGDTGSHPSMRHEVPLEILDAFLFVERDGQAFVLTNQLERARIAEVLPGARIALADELGLFDLVEQGLTRRDAELEVTVRALAQWGVTAAAVPDDLPVAIADRLRAAGVELTVDAHTVAARRRVKSAAELRGIRRAQRAAEAGMAAAERLIRGAERAGGRLRHDGEELTAEIVRDAIRAACATLGCPAPPDIMVVSALSGGGHDPGSGPLPADLPITIDVWPRDEASGCWADMARTFVRGDAGEEVAALAVVVRAALDAARDAARPGVTGRTLYDLAAQIVEDAGFPTQRTRTPGEALTHGFWFSLGHGVGLEVHEPPGVGLAGGDPLVAGDVIAIEPGIEDLEGIGGVRFEDLLLITPDGCETLTEYPYDL